MHRLYKRLAVALFGKLGDLQGFQKLKPQLEAAGIPVLAATWGAVTILTSLLAALLAFGMAGFLLLLVPLDALTAFLLLFTVPVFAGLMTFILLYTYPGSRTSRVKRSIENDMPFALAHLSAIASSGISPEYMFELLTSFDEYKHIAHQAAQVVRNIRLLGMSSVGAITAVAENTPSPTFKQVLTGIVFNIEKGGDITTYIKQMADQALFDYKLRREKYLKTLGTYADIYAALLVAAPLMMLAVLGILAVIGGEILGLAIPDLIALLTYIVLPTLNLAFLGLLHVTYPGV
ncbi:MAG: type II secretion system F family protein [Candidatus Aenigmarchaeota archaeon]|nr:type II secretion system F family protein [Candidatus Aenigmarchaeota archaeon]